MYDVSTIVSVASVCSLFGFGVGAIMAIKMLVSDGRVATREENDPVTRIERLQLNRTHLRSSRYR